MQALEEQFTKNGHGWPTTAERLFSCTRRQCSAVFLRWVVFLHEYESSPDKAQTLTGSSLTSVYISAPRSIDAVATATCVFARQCPLSCFLC